jgi:hypothetical protein
MKTQSLKQKGPTMIQIKKLKHPTKRSGWTIWPGDATELKSFGIVITNTGKVPLYVDRVGTKNAKKKRS